MFAKRFGKKNDTYKKCGRREKKANINSEVRYDEANEEFFKRVLVKEQPFYRPGMSESEIVVEMEYMNNNTTDVLIGNYKPLWKQKLFR